MALTKGTLVLAGGGALAAMALAGCAPAGGYSDNSGSKQPAAVAATDQVTPSAAPSPTPASAPVGIVVDKLIATSIPKMGKVVTDGKGWVLYRFDKDTAAPPASNCSGTCAKIWPPVLAQSTPTLSGVAPEKLGTVMRADGNLQVTLAGWPLYRYIGDPKPGAWKGQNVGGTWFVVAPDGKKNVTCLPTPPPAAVAPPADPAANAGTNNGGGTTGGGGSTY
jgi:predicted lipoprotein with Yx(FWY)xxD motif